MRNYFPVTITNVHMMTLDHVPISLPRVFLFSHMTSSIYSLDSGCNTFVNQLLHLRSVYDSTQCLINTNIPGRKYQQHCLCV